MTAINNYALATNWPVEYCPLLFFNSVFMLMFMPSWSINSSPFMEAEGSLQCLQEPATGLYPGPDESCTHSYPISLRSFSV
jgi:uncharacterized membrane protein YwaF